MLIQSLGYRAQSNTRTDSFRVVDAGRKEREFTLSVPNQSLVGNQFKCQDVPDLCFAKLKEELGLETEEHAVRSQMTVSEAEFAGIIQLVGWNCEHGLFSQDRSFNNGGNHRSNHDRAQRLAGAVTQHLLKRKSYCRNRRVEGSS